MQQKNFRDTTILPLCIYYDDIETGDSRGSHAGKRAVGVVEAWIPCEPPSEASKLTSIILALLFLTKHRKMYGNEAVFGPLIKELKTLRTDGITINVNGSSQKVYFMLVLVLGDNLGLNSILGFVESFGLTFFLPNMLCWSNSNTIFNPRRPCTTSYRRKV